MCTIALLNEFSFKSFKFVDLLKRIEKQPNVFFYLMFRMYVYYYFAKIDEKYTNFSENKDECKIIVFILV